MPTAAAVLEFFVSVTQGHVDLDGVEVCQLHGWQEHHWLICQALEIDEVWYQGTADQKNNLTGPRAP